MLMVGLAMSGYTGFKRQHPERQACDSVQPPARWSERTSREGLVKASSGIMLRQGSLRLRGLACQGSLSYHASSILPQAVQPPETEAACPFSTSAAAGKPRAQEQPPSHEWGQARAPWTPTCELAKRKTLTKRMGYMLQVGRTALAFQVQAQREAVATNC